MRRNNKEIVLKKSWKQKLKKALLIPCHLASVLETCSRCKYYWNTAYSTISYDRIQKRYKLESDL
jgi:hypothetical protein